MEHCSSSTSTVTLHGGVLGGVEGIEAAACSGSFAGDLGGSGAAEEVSDDGVFDEELSTGSATSHAPDMYCIDAKRDGTYLVIRNNSLETHPMAEGNISQQTQRIPENWNTRPLADRRRTLKAPAKNLQ